MFDIDFPFGKLLAAVMFKKSSIRKCIHFYVVVLLFTGVVSAFTCIAQLRAMTSDFEYNLVLDEQNESLRIGEVRTRTLNEITAPILSMPDIQSSMEYVILGPHKTYDVHSHPRASEVLYVERGNLTLILVFGEDNSTKKVKNSLVKHHLAIVPQGITHTASCESNEDCAYVSYYNNANPGRV